MTDYWFSDKPCNDYSAGSNTIMVDTESNIIHVTDEEAKYVLNTNSMKIHLPTCSYVQSISKENKLNTIESKEDLIKQGYSPCGVCHP